MADTATDPVRAEARRLLAERFPDLRCVRCGQDDFFLRTYRDYSLSPGLDDPHVAELICSNCGYQERHLLEGLRGELHKLVGRGSDDGEPS